MIIINNILDVEKHIGDFDAIIFDLDDTLYSEKEYVRSGYREIAKYFQTIPQMEEKLWKYFLKGLKPINEILKEEGMFSEENLAKAIEIYRNHKPDIHLYDGVIELLKKIKKTNKKIGMITDGRPEGQRAKLESLKIRPFFDEIIITDELGGVEYRKPNKVAFNLIVNKLDVSFDKAVYIGDNLRKDFVAPQELKMESIFFNNADGIYKFN